MILSSMSFHSRSLSYSTLSDSDSDLSDVSSKNSLTLEILDDSHDQTCVVCQRDQAVLPVTLPCSHIFCYLCIKGVYQSGSTQCPCCRAFIPPHIINKPHTSDISIKTDGPIWVYRRRHNRGWYQFAPDNNEEVEALYQRFFTHILDASESIVQVGNIQLHLDFSQMTQKSRFGTREIRRIRNLATFPERVDGIAGISQ